MKTKIKKELVYLVLVGRKHTGYTEELVFKNEKKANKFAWEVLNSYDPFTSNNPPYVNVIQKEVII